MGPGREGNDVTPSSPGDRRTTAESMEWECGSSLKKALVGTV